MQKGTVKFFNDEKGFGFIVPADGSAELFVHKSGLKERIQQQDEVTFEVEQGKRGLAAVNVKRII